MLPLEHNYSCCHIIHIQMQDLAQVDLVLRELGGGHILHFRQELFDEQQKMNYLLHYGASLIKVQEQGISAYSRMQIFFFSIFGNSPQNRIVRIIHRFQIKANFIYTCTKYMCVYAYIHTNKYILIHMIDNFCHTFKIIVWVEMLYCSKRSYYMLSELLM